MRLAERGVVVDPAGPSLHLFADGTRLELSDDTATAQAGCRKFSAADAEALPKFEADLAELAKLVTPADRHDTARHQTSQRRRPCRRCSSWAGMAAQAAEPDQRRALPLRHLGHAVPRRTVRERLREGGDRLACDQRLDRRPLDAGHRLRPAPRPRRRRHRGRRRPRLGLRPRRHRPGHRGDGRRRARGRRGDPHRGRGRERDRRGRHARSGVVLADGAEIRATRVLSNADPKKTFLGLVDERRTADRVRRRGARATAARAPA